MTKTTWVILGSVLVAAAVGGWVYYRTSNNKPILPGG